jgi:hypothetical protein
MIQPGYPVNGGGIDMKKAVFSIFLLITAMLHGGIYADSPITSTQFYQAYMDIELVREAKISGTMNKKIFDYLSSPTNPIDVKAAIINALGWKIEGKNNSRLFLKFLSEKHRMILEPHTINTDILHADEIFCIGYLEAMDDYFHPEKSIQLLEMAKKKRRDSFTVSIVLAIVRAQEAMGSNWCTVWELTESVLSDKSLKQDLREEAKKIINDYMILYKDECR